MRLQREWDLRTGSVGSSCPVRADSSSRERPPGVTTELLCACAELPWLGRPQEERRGSRAAAYLGPKRIALRCDRARSSPLLLTTVFFCGCISLHPPRFDELPACAKQKGRHTISAESWAKMLLDDPVGSRGLLLDIELSGEQSSGAPGALPGVEESPARRAVGGRWRRGPLAGCQKSSPDL